ncbi:S1 family peptidase [Nocardioides donggukensis]|uniref:S1 family peptidase n=1 Tax=Nocardioides donggukensis TaxID=2774019 RepID=A0A927K6L1_9ACTN|nr:S1 family peptidase [Nocardioides donggukensis]MBD8868781.1 S1 family peptidase [Nocardioides donggukensis]
MRPRMLAAFAAGVMTIGLSAAPSAASTGGTVDSDNEYDNVGFIMFYDDGSRYRCSATLVSPTVVLTAAHCTDGTDGKTLVTFDPVIAEEPADVTLPRAAVPSEGYTAAEITDAGYLSGVASTHPDYSDFTDLDTWNDVGVVVLDEPVTDIEPAELAPLGTLDTIPKNELRKTLFRAVGYGTEVRKADSGPQNPTPQSFPLVRRYVDMPGQKLTPQVLQTNGNEKDPFGTGGTCFGDSGGPVFLDGQVVAVTSYGYTSNCRYLGGYQRVEIDAARDWLAGFGLS